MTDPDQIPLTRALLRRAGPLFGPLVTALFEPMVKIPQQHRRDQFAACGIPAGHIVLLGDSITEYGLWNEWFPDLPVLNRGIGGETSAQVLARLDTAIASPRAVFLLIGTNDLSIARPEQHIVADVEAILEGIEQRAPDTRVWVQSVMPRSVMFRAEVRTLNRRLRRLTDEAGPEVQYLDLWPALADERGALRPDFTRDRLHLNGKGYRAWVEVLRPHLDAASAGAGRG